MHSRFCRGPVPEDARADQGREANVGYRHVYRALCPRVCGGGCGGGSVVTIEADASAADVTRNVFKQAKHGGKIELLEADARAEVADMARRGEKFDMVFLDGDKD